MGNTVLEQVKDLYCQRNGITKENYIDVIKRIIEIKTRLAQKVGVAKQKELTP